MRHLWRVILGIVMGGMMTACQSTSGPGDEKILDNAPVLAPDDIEDGLGTDEEDPPSEPVEVVPPKPRFVMENIMNLAPGTLRNILGKASLVRKEKDVEVWLYQNQECTLHLYFYPNENDDMRLDYVETSGLGLSSENPTVSPNACLDSHVSDRPEDGTPSSLLQD